MVTMKDVAKLAGVSHGTVSNVLRGAKNVSLDKVRKVEDAIQTLGYRPNAFARNLKTNHTMQIDVILPNILDPALAQLYSSISMSAGNKGYNTSLHITNDVAVVENRFLNSASMYNTDGVVLMTSQPENRSYFESFIKDGMKIVFLQRMVEGLDSNSVYLDAADIIDDFVKKSYTDCENNLMLFTEPTQYTFDRNVRRQFLDSCKKYYNENMDSNTYVCSGTCESAFKQAVAIFQSNSKRCVALATTQLIAEGIYKALEVLNIPQKQVKVVMLCNQSWLYSSEAMSDKMVLPYSEMGETAFNLLYSSIQTPAFSENKKIKIEIALQNNWLFMPKEKIFENQNKEPLKVLMLDSSAASATQSLLHKFNKATGLKVEIETMPFNLLYNSILKGFSTNNFDICEVDLPWISPLVDQNILISLDEVNSNYRGYMRNIMEEVIPEYTTYNGKVYAFPYMYCSQLLFYRKDLFEDLSVKRLFWEKYKAELQPPKTWNEFNAVARFFTKKYNPESKTIYGTTLGAKLYNGAVCEYLPRLWYYGGSVIKDGEVCIDSEEALKALNNYKESFLYASPASPDRWWEEQTEEFCEGQTAMMMLFNAHATDIVDLSKSKVVGKVGFDIIPGKISLIGGWSLGISTKSKRKQDALKFLEWICSDNISIENTILGGCSPCKKVYDDAEIALIYPWHRAMFDVYRYARSRTLPADKKGNIISYFQFEKILGTVIHNTVSGRMDTKEALMTAASQLRDLYRGNNSKS